MHSFQPIQADMMDFDTIKRIGSEWMLITSGDKEKVNTMTASWGGIGVLWHNDVAFIFVRDSRYTREFIEKTGKFSLSFFDGEFKKEMKYLGMVSGRDEDKIANILMNVNYHEPTGVPFIDEAKLVLICEKLSDTIIKPEDMVDPEMAKEFYGDGDLHHMYVGKIVEFLAR